MSAPKDVLSSFGDRKSWIQIAALPCTSDLVDACRPIENTFGSSYLSTGGNSMNVIGGCEN